MRNFRKVLATFILAATVRGADDLPRRAPGEAMDFEPGLLLTLPSPREPIAGVPRIEVALDRAKRSASEGERLFRAGAIAKVEAERRSLKVVRLLSDLAAAREEAAKADLEAKRAQLEAGTISQKAIAVAEAALVAAASDAAEAAATWQRAELTAAELNLSRHRKLLAAGIGSRTMVHRAEAQLAALKSKSAPAVPQKNE